MVGEQLALDGNDLRVVGVGRKGRQIGEIATHIRQATALGEKGQSVYSLSRRERGPERSVLGIFVVLHHREVAGVFRTLEQPVHKQRTARGIWVVQVLLDLLGRGNAADQVQ